MRGYMKNDLRNVSVTADQYLDMRVAWLDSCLSCSKDHDEDQPCWWVAHKERHPECACQFCHYFGDIKRKY